jgi:hypothetical protein
MWGDESDRIVSGLDLTPWPPPRSVAGTPPARRGGTCSTAVGIWRRVACLRYFLAIHHYSIVPLPAGEGEGVRFGDRG